MILVFNQLNFLLGTFGGSFNVIVTRAATAAAESNNEAIWLANTDDT